MPKVDIVTPAVTQSNRCAVWFTLAAVPPLGGVLGAGMMGDDDRWVREAESASFSAIFAPMAGVIAAIVPRDPRGVDRNVLDQWLA